MANVSSFSGAMPVIPGGTVELGYSQITSAVSVTSAAFPAATEVIAPLTVVCDGGPILVEFFAPSIRPNNTSGDEIWLSLFMDGSESIRQWAYATTPAANWTHFPTRLAVRLSPSAGSHTFGVKARVTNASRAGSVDAGTGASTTSAPAFLRVSKIVNQNDGLKPFWTPPVVTSLPSQATVGDQVVNYTTNGAYQPYFYTGATDGWKQVGTSKPPMALAKFTANQTVNTATDTTLALDAATFQTDGTMVTSSGSNSKITVNTSGVYAVNAHITFDGKNATGVRYFGLMKNGSGVPSNLEGFMPLAVTPSNSWLTFSGSTIVSFTSGDYINAKMYQSSGVNVTTVANYTSYLSVQWIGPTP